MADKRISQLIERVDIANNDVLPIVASGATTTNKVTISTIQDWMQDNLDVGVTSVGITFGTSGTDINATGSPVTSSGNITINLPTASATNRGALSSADWITFNSKQPAGNYVTLDTTQIITAQKTFTTSGGSDSVIISHGSGSGIALDVIKAGNGEAIRIQKTSGSGNAMTISGGNFEAGTIVKTGGTSSQFLKADGSVDSSTYLTTGTAASTYVPYTGAAASVNLGVYSITAKAINSAGSGSTAGQINLRSDAFFSLVNGYGTIGSGTTNQFNLYQTTGAGVFRGAILSLNSITESATRTFTFPDADGTLALTSQIPTNPVGGTGAAGRVAYWNGSGTITSDSLFQWNDTFNRLGIGKTPTVSLDVEGAGFFSGNLTFGNFKTDANVFKSNKPNEQGAFLRAAVSTASNPTFAFEDDEDTGMYRVTTNSLGFTTGGTTRLTISSTGAATFSSSVTATSGKFASANGTTYAATPQLRIDGNGVNNSYAQIVFTDSALSDGKISYFPAAAAENRFFSISARQTESDFVIRGSGNVGIGTASPTSVGTYYTSLELKGKSGGTGNEGGYYLTTDADGSTVGQFGVDGNFVYIGSRSNTDAVLVRNNSEMLRVTANGLTFNGDTAAANALDDYEEGTWTPTISFGGASVGITYAVRNGQYTKIGRQVSVSAYILLTNKGTSTGFAAINGLPFTIGAGSSFYTSASFSALQSITYNGSIQGYGAVSTNYIRLNDYLETGIQGDITNVDFANDAQILVSMTYFV